MAWRYLVGAAGMGGATLYQDELLSFSGVANIVNTLRAAGMTTGSPGVSQQVAVAMQPFNEQMLAISSELARLRVQSAHHPGYYSRGTSWMSIISVGGVAVFALYGLGFSFADFMYVTKKALAVAVEALEQGIENVGVQLEAAKRELTYKLGLVEEKVEETRVSLEAKISSEVGEVKKDLSMVGQDVKSVAQVQNEVHEKVEGLERDFKYLEHQIDGAADQLANANTGITLLCKAVVTNMSVGRRDNEVVIEEAETTYQNLKRYLENSLEPLKSSLSFGFAVQKSAPKAGGPQGLKVLVPSEEKA